MYIYTYIYIYIYIYIKQHTIHAIGAMLYILRNKFQKVTKRYKKLQKVTNDFADEQNKRQKTGLT